MFQRGDSLHEITLCASTSHRVTRSCSRDFCGCGSRFCGCGGVLSALLPLRWSRDDDDDDDDDNDDDVIVVVIVTVSLVVVAGPQRQDSIVWSLSAIKD